MCPGFSGVLHGLTVHCGGLDWWGVGWGDSVVLFRSYPLLMTVVKERRAVTRPCSVVMNIHAHGLTCLFSPPST